VLNIFSISILLFQEIQFDNTDSIKGALSPMTKVFQVLVEYIDAHKAFIK